MPGTTRWSPALNLDRFHLTPKVHQFVGGLLDGMSDDQLCALADELHGGGHRFLLTRDLIATQSYLRERYADAKFARYGVCRLDTVATEFSSQGLELDCALLAWGSDLLWKDGDWSIDFAGKNRPPLKNPLSVRKMSIASC